MKCSNFEKIINLAAKDTRRGVRVVAKVFYRVLRKKGFSESQIIDIATNILNCLIESLNRGKNKIDATNKSKEKPRIMAISSRSIATKTIAKFARKHENQVSVCSAIL